jgi:hypothetical protein
MAFTHSMVEDISKSVCIGFPSQLRFVLRINRKGSFMVKRISSVILATLLAYQPIQLLYGFDQQASVKEIVRGARVKEKVEGLGIGAVVVAKLNNAREQRGQIDSIAEESFQLVEKKQSVPLRYTDVAELHLVNPKYKTSGTVDPSRVRQIVFDFGIGQRAKLKQRSGMKSIGDIRSIDKDGFTISDSNTNKNTYVSFRDVFEIEKKSRSEGVGRQIAWVGIGVGAVMGILLAIVLARGGVD